MVLRITWLALIALLAGCFAWFGSGAALALVLVLVVISLAGVPVNLYLRKKLELTIRSDVSLKKGDEGTIWVTIHNPTMVPILKVRCQVTVYNQLTRQKNTLELTTWAPIRKTSSVSLRMASRYCGRVRLEVSQAVLYDCFGLIGVPLKKKASAHMTVQAETFETNVVLLPNPGSNDDSDVYSQERPGSDLSETYQIREYVPGDNPKQIHWKLSNKFDKLIVRDPGLPITRKVLVFWERTADGRDPARIDAQAEVVISLCRSLMDREIPFTIGWNDTDRNLCILHEIRDMDALVGIIPRILRATGSREGVSGAALLVQTHPEALCEHMVYIAHRAQPEVLDMERYGHVTKLICGNEAPDGAVVFQEYGYSQQLTQIEL